MDEAAEFDKLVARALARLPPQFAAQLDSVAIVIDDEASAEELASVGAAGLFGLYNGVPRTALRADWAAVASKITIFRRPLEAAFGRNPERLAQAVEETLFHEIAHHLGISDARLHQLAAENRGTRSSAQN